MKKLCEQFEFIAKISIGNAPVMAGTMLDCCLQYVMYWPIKGDTHGIPLVAHVGFLHVPDQYGKAVAFS